MAKGRGKSTPADGTANKLRQLLDMDLKPHFDQLLARFDTRPLLDELAEAAAAPPPWARKLAADVAEATKPPAGPTAKKRRSPQVDRVMQALPELYPDGIAGIPNPVVRQKVADYLQPETKKGLAVPGRDAINRALRKYRTR